MKKNLQKGAKSAKGKKTESKPKAAGAVSATAVCDGELRRVPVASCVPGPNPRKTFILDDLLPSIRELGITQPMLVRPVPKVTLEEPSLLDNGWRLMRGSVELEAWPETDADAERKAKAAFKAAKPAGEFEIVAGERRWRCATELKLREVPVIVRPMGDKEAYELMQAENLAREGLTAIEEAQSYQDAIDRKMYADSWRESVKAMADKFAKSSSHIAGRLSLLKLGEGARSALCRGELDQTIALLVASIPGEERQAEAVKGIVNGYNGPMTFEEAKRYIENEFRRSLKGAPFDAGDAELYPEAGVCAKCPKRIAPNVCTDTKCYAEKARLTLAGVAEKFSKAGRVVLENTEKIFPYNDAYLGHGCGYVKASEVVEDDPKKRTYRELLEKKLEPAVALTKTGVPVELFPLKGLQDALRGAGHTFMDEKRKDAAKAKAEAEFERLVNLELMTDALRMAEEPGNEEAFLRAMVDQATQRFGIMKRVFARRGEPEIETDESWVDSLTVPQMRSYLLEIAYTGFDGDFPEAAGVAGHFKISAVVVRDRVHVRTQAHAKADGEKKGKKN